MKYNRFWLFFFSSIWTITLFAQSQSSAEEHIKNLKNGAAIVRLYMNKPKTDALTKSINNPKISSSDKKRFEYLLKEHKEDRDIYVSKVIDNFNSYYFFSKVYFIYDYDWKKFKEGQEGLLLNANGDYDPKIKMMESDYYIFGQGNSDEVWVIYDSDGNTLPTNFPSRFNANIFQGIAQMFKNDAFGSYIKGLNKKLKNFYRKVTEVEDEE